MTDTTFRYILILITLLLFACSNSIHKTANRTVLLNKYRFEGKYRTDTIFQKIEFVKNRIDYIYSEQPNNDTVLGFSFYFNKDSDSVMHIFNHECPLIESKIYKIKGRKYEIKKYYYDIKRGSDEETSIYYNKIYGLLVAFNDGWMQLSWTINYDKTSSELVDLIISDTCDFYHDKSIIRIENTR